MGFGASRCAQFAKQYPLDPDLSEGVYFSWGQGFKSAFNDAERGQKQKTEQSEFQAAGRAARVYT